MSASATPAQLAVAPDAAQHRLTQHPVRLRRAGEPSCWAAAGSATGVGWTQQRTAVVVDGGVEARWCGQRRAWVWLAQPGGVLEMLGLGSAMAAGGGMTRVGSRCGAGRASATRSRGGRAGRCRGAVVRAANGCGVAGAVAPSTGRAAVTRDGESGRYAWRGALAHGVGSRQVTGQGRGVRVRRPTSGCSGARATEVFGSSSAVAPRR